MTEQDLMALVEQIVEQYPNAVDVLPILRVVLTLKAERDALKAQLGDMLNGRMSCGEPTLDRSERRCDKPRGHSGNHWTYGGAGLEWPRDAPMTDDALDPLLIALYARFDATSHDAHDRIVDLTARLHTVEQERDAAKAQCQFMEDAHELALEQLQALGPPVPACPHCERVNSRHLEPPSQSAVERCCPVTSRWQCRQCGMTFSEPTYYRQVTGQS